MTSRIGSKPEAFTLVEAMVATAILSLAVVLIYQAFFVSLDRLNYINDYFNVCSFLDDKIWQAQDALAHLNALDETETAGTITFDNRSFNWNLLYVPVGRTPNLYRIDAAISWRRGEKDIVISRSAYAAYTEDKK